MNKEFTSPLPDPLGAAPRDTHCHNIGCARSDVFFRSQASDRHANAISKLDVASVGSMLDVIADAALLVDKAGEIILANTATKSVLGYDKPAIVGRSIDTLVPPRYRSVHRTHLRSFFSLTPRPDMTARPLVVAVNAAGEEVSVSVSLSAFELADGPVALALVRDATMLQQRLTAAIRKSEIDPLTGIGNRALFSRKIQSMLKAGDPFTVLYMDLWQFKVFNDMYGHNVGDEVLRVVAKRISGSIRSNDVAARIGGDEFAMLIATLGRGKQLQSRIESIAISLIRPLRIDGVTRSVCANLGAATFPHDGDSEATLMERADKNMYQARLLGAFYLG